MVCGPSFMVSLFLLTLGILLIPKYYSVSPFLFYACYIIWKESEPPELSDHRDYWDVQPVYQDDIRKVSEPPDNVVEVFGKGSCSEESECLDKVA